MQSPLILGVLGGNDLPLELLTHWVNRAEVLLAADSGADRLQAAGFRANWIVGDLDSVSPQALAEIHNVEKIETQQSTDCDKLLELAHRLGYDELTLIGIEGDRPDHVLTTLHSVARAKLKVRLVMRRGEGVILRGPVEHLQPSKEGQLVSLIPLEACEGVTIDRVAWPLIDVSLSIDCRTSISNRALGDVVEVEIQSGTALLFWERQF